MNFTTKVGDLKEALNIIGTTIDRRPDSETSKVYIEAKANDNYQRVILFSTDSIAKTLMRVDATVKEEGAWVFAPRSIQAMLTGFGDEESVSFVSKKNAAGALNGKVEVKVGGAKSVISGNKAMEALKLFLSLVPVNKKETVAIPVPVMLELISRTAPFVMKQGQIEDRAGFRNLQMVVAPSGYAAVSTNTQVIAQSTVLVELKDQKTETILIPVKAIGELTKILSRSKLNKESETVKIVYPDNDGDSPSNIYFRFKDTIYGTSASNQNFPNVSGVYSKIAKGVEVLVDRKRMADNLVRCRAFCDTKHVHLRLENGKVMIKTSGIGGELEEEIETKLIKEEDMHAKASINIEMDHLESVIYCSKEDWISISFGSGKPVLLIDAPASKTNLSSYIVAGAE